MQSVLVDFAKMEGIGNKIIVVDMRGCVDNITTDAINLLSMDDIINFDQIMFIHDSHNSLVDAFIRIINHDGSEAQSCGNGMRCVVRFLSSKMKTKYFTFETIRGLIVAKVNADGSISIDMGEPIFYWKHIPLAQPFDEVDRDKFHIGPINHFYLHSPFVVSMGNPHAIFFVENDIYQYDLSGFGQRLERNSMFPEGVNVSIAQVTSCSDLNLRTWERGAGLTAACGSASCASVVASGCLGKTGRVVSVKMLGGSLSIEWHENNHVFMTGEANKEWDGKLDIKTGKWTKNEV
ncbi:diaminopimelate epimerase [Candidatus Liberibacter africanus]|uniref:Diaminopimelate epimerase n=1 Tax=Candidatus Liberibacter africanus PTSAPSY TaxID=1277257 RepID=A0A0G3I6C2_LIBAF|nr:diaminopimelate epimerase [Candidatus Liberibacter africanus]AKK20008.1 diaminopimelate epimerase [Candidatus Liberibacter africanus PTSAPSY]QTP63837.1 diaminopimelate epimerase [Candidatus Liberibacter africanus]